MLLIIQALYLVTFLLIVTILFLDFQRHRRVKRHMFLAWVLFVGHSIVFPQLVYGLFFNHQDALLKFFPDGPIGPHNIVWLFAAVVVGFILWALFILILRLRSSITKRFTK